MARKKTILNALHAAYLDFDPDGEIARGGIGKAVGWWQRRQARKDGKPLSDEQLLQAPIADLTPKERERRSTVKLVGMAAQSREQRAAEPNEGNPTGSVATNTAAASSKAADELVKSLPKEQRDLLKTMPPANRNRIIAGWLEQRKAPQPSVVGEPSPSKATAANTQPNPSPEARSERPRRPEPTSPPVEPSITDKWKAAKAKQPADQPPQTKESALQSKLADQARAQLEGDPNPEPNKAPEHKPSKLSTAVDTAQYVGDLIGVFDPTGIADGINATVSATRTFTDPKRARRHAGNAAISVASMVPYVGDLAKLAKGKQVLKTAKRVGKFADDADDARKVSKARRAGTHADDVEDGAKLTSQAQRSQGKRKQSKRYKKGMKGIVERLIDEEYTRQDADGSNGNGPPDDPDAVPVGPGDPGDPKPRNTTVNDARRRQRGLEEHDRWTDKLKDGVVKVGKFVGVVGTAGLALGAMVKKVSSLNEYILEMNRELAPWNGKIAAAYARADADQIRREMERGSAIAEPLSDLSREQSELKDHKANWTVPMQQIGYTLEANATSFTNQMLTMQEMIIPIQEYLKIIADWASGADGEADMGTAAQQFLADISDGKLDSKRPDFARTKPKP